VNDTALFFSLMIWAAGGIVLVVSPVFGDGFLPYMLGSLTWPLSLPVVAIVRTAMGRPILTGRERVDRVPRATARNRRIS
jgi:hypothetical protein